MIVISQYSGKCDFCDTVEIHGIENILKSKIFVGNDLIPLRIDSEKDLVPFYPRIVVMSSSTNGVGSFFLANESYVDTEEKEILGWYQRDILSYIKKCQRKKIVPHYDDMPQFLREHNKEAKIEIFNRLLDKNESLDNIHLPVRDYYRKELYKEMLRVGWDKDKAYSWCFGWRRWVEKFAKKE